MTGSMNSTNIRASIKTSLNYVQFLIKILVFHSNERDKEEGEEVIQRLIVLQL